MQYAKKGNQGDRNGGHLIGYGVRTIFGPNVERC